MRVNWKTWPLCGILALLATTPAWCGRIEGAGPIDGSALGFTSANSIAINPDGVGHILLVPYFSTQGGNTTVISLVNNDNRTAKAVKVRFRSAVQADTVFDLTVFLAPNDVWNAAVSQHPLTGIAQLSTSENSCTLPALIAGHSYAFNTARLNPALSDADRAAQTREGYIEIITMADIPATTNPSSLYQSIYFFDGIKPKDCASPAVMATLTNATEEPAAAALGFATPTGSLRGAWTIINVAQTLTYSGKAQALLAVDDASGQPGRGAYMFYPQSDAFAGNVDTVTADPLHRTSPLASKTADGQSRGYATAFTPLVKPAMSDMPDLSTPYILGMADPMSYSALLSRLIAVKSVKNDYATDQVVEAATDWVFSFPTKRFSVAMDYLQGKLVYNVMTGYGGIEYFSGENTTLKDGRVCMDHRFTFFDRDGASRTTGGSEQTVLSYIKLCGSVGVVQFGAIPTSALGAKLTSEATDTRAFANGWGRIDTSNGYTGTPLLGAAFIKARNANASPGVSGNYGISSNHKYLR